MRGVAKMKARINAKNLAQALAHLVRVVPLRTPSPELQHILMESTASGLILSATDEVVYVRVVVPAEVMDSGATTAPARLLTDVVRVVGDEIVLEASATSLRVQAGSKVVTLATIPRNEFLDRELGGELICEIDGDILIDAIRRVGFSAARDDSRPVLHGICFNILEGQLSLVTGDGFRATIYDLEMEMMLTGQCVVPTPALNVLTPLFRGKMIRIEHQPNRLIFKSEDMACSSQIVIADFPHLRPLIKTDHPINAQVNRDEFLAALRLASLISDRSVILEFGEGIINITSAGQQVGDSHMDVPAKIEGGTTIIGLRPDFITEAVSAIKADTVQIGVTNDSAILTLFDENFLHGLMPVTIHQGDNNDG